jgi:hypothetical protein
MSLLRYIAGKLNWRGGGDDPILVSGTNLSIHLPCGCAESDLISGKPSCLQEIDLVVNLSLDGI